MPKISFVILTYNSASHIPHLFESIERTQNLDEIELIVVDNASTDNTIDIVKNSKLKVNLRELPRNIGFASGINMGAEIAKGKYLLFLNPDASIVKGDLREMIELIDKKDVGIVGGRMKNGEVNEKSAGKSLGLVSSLLLIFGLDEKFGARFSPRGIQEVGFVSGGFMMVDKSIFDKLKGFDEEYFMYVEDADLCLRAKSINQKTYFTPNVIVEHLAHGSSNREFAIKNIAKSLIYYHKKNSSHFTYLIVKSLLKLKATVLVLIGKVLNNKYLVDAYIDVTRL